MTQPLLKLVDPETGELHDLAPCPTCAEASDVIAGLERTIRSQGATIVRIQRNRASDAENHELYPVAELIYEHWKARCTHPRAKFGWQEFEQIQPFLAKHGEEMCRRAVEGIAFDHFTDMRRNGTTRRHDGWELLFRNSTKFMEFANRAPKEKP